MLIAHLPAGYLLARRIAPRLEHQTQGIAKLGRFGLRFEYATQQLLRSAQILTSK